MAADGRIGLSRADVFAGISSICLTPFACCAEVTIFALNSVLLFDVDQPRLHRTDVLGVGLQGLGDLKASDGGFGSITGRGAGPSRRRVRHLS